MSMLSAQCDELRTMAESVGLAMPQAATLMMEAADTIWELRGSVHRERAEADRLRELVEEDSEQLDKWQKKAEYYSQLSQLSEAENTKLRDSLKALVIGTYAELCVDRDQPQCKECAMRRGDESCVVADAMELLEIDVYGEPLGGRR